MITKMKVGIFCIYIHRANFLSTSCHKSINKIVLLIQNQDARKLIYHSLQPVWWSHTILHMRKGVVSQTILCSINTVSSSAFSSAIQQIGLDHHEVVYKWLRPLWTRLPPLILHACMLDLDRIYLFKLEHS